MNAGLDRRELFFDLRDSLRRFLLLGQSFEVREKMVRFFHRFVEFLRDRMAFIQFSQRHAFPVIPFFYFIESLAEPEERTGDLMGNEDRAPAQEEKEQSELPKKRAVRVDQDALKDFTLALAQLFGLSEKRKSGKIICMTVGRNINAYVFR